MKRTISGTFVLAMALAMASSMGIAGQVIPNDLGGEYWSMQWHLHNAGQSGGTPNADINAPEAWEITTGDPNIVIAVLDTGVDLNHPDLVNNLVPGYDVLDGDDSPAPVPGSHQHAAHGTSCAGIVAAQGNNGMGVVGVTWNSKIMPVRVNLGDLVATDVAVEAIRWAALNGADVLSCSISTDTSSSPLLYSALEDVTKPGGIGRNGKGCILVFSAGNYNASIPGLKKSPRVITVGATDHHDQRWSYSNYGPGLDIVAPTGGGSDLRLATTDMIGTAGYTTADYRGGGWTSMACPVVAGVAALMLSVEPDLTNAEVQHFLLRSTRDLGAPGWDDYYGWGRVDARAALDMVLAKRSDLSNDWKVDIEDLLILIEFWGMAESSADIAPATKRDGIVDEQDLELMMQYWQTEIPEMGLIARWKLDEAEGSVAYDSASIHDGVLTGEPVWQPDGGKVGGALLLNGVDDHISTPAILDPAEGDFSVFAWIKGGAAGQVIVSQEGGVNWLMADPVDGTLRTDLKVPAAGGRGPTPAGPSLISSTMITGADWHKVGFVRDGSDRILYVDDIEVARDTAETVESADGGLYIGTASTLDLGTFFSGLIDDVRIYDRAVRP